MPTTGYHSGRTGIADFGFVYFPLGPLNHGSVHRLLRDAPLGSSILSPFRDDQKRGCAGPTATLSCYVLWYLEVDLYSSISSLSAEAPLQLLNYSCAGLHWEANNKRSGRTVKTPRTCNGVRHLPHRTH